MCSIVSKVNYDSMISFHLLSEINHLLNIFHDVCLLQMTNGKFDFLSRYSFCSEIPLIQQITHFKVYVYFMSSKWCNIDKAATNAFGV